MRLLYTLFLSILAMPVSASLVDNGSHTTDTSSGLDWLDLNATFGQNIVDAQAANSGWRLATENELQGLFGQLFPNFVETDDWGCYPGPSCGTSFSGSGAPIEQVADIQNFFSLFGAVEINPGIDEGFFWSTGLYIDDRNIVRNMGAGLYFPPDNFQWARVRGMEYNGIYTSSDSWDWAGTYMVRTTAVPIPAAAWLFGSALTGLGWLRRRQTV